MHRYAARRISTPLDTRLVNRAESRDTTEVSRNVIPFIPLRRGNMPVQRIETHIGAESKCHPPSPPRRRGKHAPSVNRETYYSFMNFTTHALLLL